MTERERGILLLCAELSDGLKPLSTARLRRLKGVVRAAGPLKGDPEREITEEDLSSIGCREEAAKEIMALLSRGEALERYLALGREYGIRPLTICSSRYPARLRSKLGDAAPPVLYCKGDLSLLSRPAVSLVGSRELPPDGIAFARRVGELAAREGFGLVSGNARGADQTAQEACLAAGGAVISVVADELFSHVLDDRNVLWLCETGWQLGFSSARAFGRNRLIHALGEKTLVAGSGLRGGTFSGTAENLRHGWSPVFIRPDAGPGAKRLLDLGADPCPEEPESLAALTGSRVCFLEKG